jgi:hypothetical protein
MVVRAHRAFLAIFLLVLAPIGAVVLVSALLLFGVRPPLVFAPGRGVKSLIEMGGFHVPNAVGVVSTVIFFWAIIAAGGLVWERRK